MLDIVAAIETVTEERQHFRQAERVLHFGHRAVGHHAHRHADLFQQRFCPADGLQLKIKQPRNLLAIGRFQYLNRGIKMVLLADIGDNVVQLHAFVFLEHLLQRQLRAELRKGVHIGLGTEHFTVHQRAVAIKKNTLHRHTASFNFLQG